MENTPPEVVKDACLLVEALGDEFRQKIVQQFVTQQLSLYRMVFRKDKKESKLENVHQRYSWLRKHIDRFNQDYGKIFPQHWDIPQEMVVEFCLQTREDVHRILKEEKDSLEATVLNRSLLSTIRFEREMHSRYHVVTSMELEKQLDRERQNNPFGISLSPLEERNLMKTPEGIKQKYRYLVQQRKLEQQTIETASKEIEMETKNVSRKSYNFLGFISKVYEEYMGTYIDYEEQYVDRWDFADYFIGGWETLLRRSFVKKPGLWKTMWTVARICSFTSTRQWRIVLLSAREKLSSACWRFGRSTFLPMQMLFSTSLKL